MQFMQTAAAHLLAGGYMDAAAVKAVEEYVKEYTYYMDQLSTTHDDVKVVAAAPVLTVAAANAVRQAVIPAAAAAAAATPEGRRWLYTCVTLVQLPILLRAPPASALKETWSAFCATQTIDSHNFTKSQMVTACQERARAVSAALGSVAVASSSSNELGFAVVYAPDTPGFRAPAAAALLLSAGFIAALADLPIPDAPMPPPAAPAVDAPPAFPPALTPREIMEALRDRVAAGADAASAGLLHASASNYTRATVNEMFEEAQRKRREGWDDCADVMFVVCDYKAKVELDQQQLAEQSAGFEGSENKAVAFMCWVGVVDKNGNLATSFFGTHSLDQKEDAASIAASMRVISGQWADSLDEKPGCISLEPNLKRVLSSGIGRIEFLVDRCAAQNWCATAIGFISGSAPSAYQQQPLPGAAAAPAPDVLPLPAAVRHGLRATLSRFLKPAAIIDLVSFWQRHGKFWADSVSGAWETVWRQWRRFAKAPLTREQTFVSIPSQPHWHWFPLDDFRGKPLGELERYDSIVNLQKYHRFQVVAGSLQGAFLVGTQSPLHPVAFEPYSPPESEKDRSANQVKNDAAAAAKRVLALFPESRNLFSLLYRCGRILIKGHGLNVGQALDAPTAVFVTSILRAIVDSNRYTAADRASAVRATKVETPRAVQSVMEHLSYCEVARETRLAPPAPVLDVAPAAAAAGAGAGAAAAAPGGAAPPPSRKRKKNPAKQPGAAAALADDEPRVPQKRPRVAGFAGRAHGGAAQAHVLPVLEIRQSSRTGASSAAAAAAATAATAAAAVAAAAARAQRGLRSLL